MLLARAYFGQEAHISPLATLSATRSRHCRLLSPRRAAADFTGMAAAIDFGAKTISRSASAPPARHADLADADMRHTRHFFALAKLLFRRCGTRDKTGHIYWRLKEVKMIFSRSRKEGMPGAFGMMPITYA